MTLDEERALAVRAMFQRIVARYDLVNRIMTLGLDQRWRARAAALARPHGGLALDVGTGTGDLALALLARGARSVVGVDFAPAMLARAGAKAGRNGALSLALADALELPFREASFDCVTAAFVLRNLPHPSAGLAEIARVLRPGGRLVALELVRPRQNLRSAPLRLYFRHLVPILGGIVSGDFAAYRYLPRSAQSLTANDLARAVAEAGLEPEGWWELAGGMVSLHLAVRPKGLEPPPHHDG
jgi:demethylmenaquinone methyltransferase/2-methoxy-6-polyprenyl-1,4-benzoquinol methylase